MSKTHDEYLASRRALADAMTDEEALAIMEGARAPADQRIFETLARMTAASMRATDALREKVEMARKGGA